jgi:hypothetical protein
MRGISSHSFPAAASQYSGRKPSRFSKPRVLSSIDGSWARREKGEGRRTASVSKNAT